MSKHSKKLICYVNETIKSSMKLTTKTLGTSIILLGSLSSTAIAEDTGFYLKFLGGSTKLTDTDVFLESGSAAESVFGGKVVDKFDSGFRYDLNIGYDFGSFRLEGGYSDSEVYMKSAESKTKNASTSYAQGTVSSENFTLGLFYDFENKSKFTPFLGGGLFTSTMKISNLCETWTGEVSRNTCPTVSSFKEETHDGTGYFSRAGFSYEINKKYSLSTEVEYAWLPSILRISGTANYPTPNTLNVLVGLTYKF